MNDTERGVSSSGLLKPNDDSLGEFGRMRFGSAVTMMTSLTPPSGAGASGCAAADLPKVASAMSSAADNRLRSRRESALRARSVNCDHASSLSSLWGPTAQAAGTSSDDTGVGCPYRQA